MLQHITEHGALQLLYLELVEIWWLLSQYLLRLSEKGLNAHRFLHLYTIHQYRIPILNRLTCFCVGTCTLRCTVSTVVLLILNREKWGYVIPVSCNYAVHIAVRNQNSMASVSCIKDKSGCIVYKWYHYVPRDEPYKIEKKNIDISWFWKWVLCTWIMYVKAQDFRISLIFLLKFHKFTDYGSWWRHDTKGNPWICFIRFLLQPNFKSWYKIKVNGKPCHPLTRREVRE